MATASKKAKPTQASNLSQREATLEKVPVRKPRSPMRQPPAPPVSPAKTSKRHQLAALLLRDEGATIEQMVGALAWLPHTARAALTDLKKLGYVIDSDKIDGLRTYRAIAPK